MKTRFQKNKVCGLTLVEVLIVIAVLVLLVALLLPNLANRNHRSPRIACVNDLKQVGLAFRVWEGDNGGKFPMQVSVTNGGTMELVASGVAFRHFQVMSNELNTPKILFCPNESDRTKRQSNIWEPAMSKTSLELVPFASNTNTSYFVGVDAVNTSPGMFLAGDHNITNSLLVKSGLLGLTTNQPAGWTDNMHSRQGNVLLTDGSVQQFTTSGLRNAFENTGVITNRLAMP